MQNPDNNFVPLPSTQKTKSIFKRIIGIIICIIAIMIMASPDMITVEHPAPDQVTKEHKVIPEPVMYATIANPITAQENHSKSEDVDDYITYNFTIYKKYLLTLQKLTNKFLQDQNFAEELEFLNNIEFPASIYNTLQELQKYNNKYLVNPINSRQVIFPVNYVFMQKFLKISKPSAEFLHKQEEYKKLKAQLMLLANFFYSEALQKSLAIEVK